MASKACHRKGFIALSSSLQHYHPFTKEQDTFQNQIQGNHWKYSLQPRKILHLATTLLATAHDSMHYLALFLL